MLHLCEHLEDPSSILNLQQTEQDPKREGLTAIECFNLVIIQGIYIHIYIIHTYIHYRLLWRELISINTTEVLLTLLGQWSE